MATTAADTVMSNIVTGRARVVYVGDEFIHLSKGGLDGKIVAFRDSWLANNYDLQDWVTFKAKPYEAEPPHCNFGVRFKALAKSVKFESKAVMSEGIGTFFKVDEYQGQYGFISVCFDVLSHMLIALFPLLYFLGR
ncbi:unnamed protein product [Gongylonema pulchrum]|uniref:Uncharacterized protein n=1 Tax=Gongylonema pulchrum TaxID=637853 RepID=A0A3P7PPF6_9BILA|nr:unnamed protein product [Gongylonema pulchrum]